MKTKCQHIYLYNCDHLQRIQFCKYSYVIPWCYCRRRRYCSYAFLFHTRLHLKIIHYWITSKKNSAFDAMEKLNANTFTCAIAAISNVSSFARTVKRFLGVTADGVGTAIMGSFFALVYI